MIKLIAGLGNPGEKYAGTRHNIGFDVIDKLSDEFSLSFTEKYFGEYAETVYEGRKIYFLKPLTFMNLSGKSVGALSSFYKISPDEVLVIHDEMNIPYNTLKIRRGGTAGGHNGLKSIIESLGSIEYPRLKMGIGKDSSKDTVSYVLGKFKPEEKQVYEEFISRGADAVKYILKEGLDKAMNIYNR